MMEKRFLIPIFRVLWCADCVLGGGFQERVRRWTWLERNRRCSCDRSCKREGEIRCGNAGEGGKWFAGRKFDATCRVTRLSAI
jgi:hypothetical protein